MRDWQERYVYELSSASSEQGLFAILCELTRLLGFEHCSYGMRTPLPAVEPKFSLFSNYPDEWSKRYVANNYFGVDPTVAHALSNTTPLLWSAEAPLSSPEFWEEAQAFQLRHGWCMPARGQFGTVGLLTLVRSAETISAEELDAKENKMHWLTTLAHSAMVDRLAPKQMPECDQTLTPREREVLQWSSAGKTYFEIAVIISVDERTVKFHLSNAMRKLRAANKAQAVFKAAVLGLL